MKKLLLIFVVLTVLVAAVILIFSRSDRSPAGAELLPATTLLYVNAPDFQAARAQLANSPLAALWNEPEIQTLFRDAIDEFHKSAGGADRINQALALPQGEVFLAITRFTATPKTDAAGLIGIDVKTRKAQAYAYIKLYEHQLSKYAPSAKLESKKYLGTTYTTVTYSPTSQLNYGLLGTILVVASDETTFRDALARFTGNSSSDALPLARNPSYLTALQRHPGNQAVRAFVNVEQLLNQFGMLLLMATQGSPALQGLNNIQAVTAGVRIETTGLTDTTLLTYGKDRPPDAPIQRHTLTAVPGDSAYYAAQTLDLAGNYNKLMQALARANNPVMTQIGANLDKFLADAGVRLNEDLLAHLGPEVAYAGNWRDTAPLPDFALIAEVKNHAAIASNYTKIVTAIGQSVRQTDENDFHVIRTDSTHVSPTYVLTEKFFVLALTPDYAREIVAQIKAGKTPLTDNADFKSVATRVPSGGTSLTYCDLRKVIGGLYNLARANATDSAFIPANKLPATTTITKHLGPYISTTVEDNQTSITTTYSPLGKPVTVVVALAGGIAAAQPWLSQLPIPGLPNMSSSTPAPPRRTGNRTATSQTPPP